MNYRLSLVVATGLLLGFGAPRALHAQDITVSAPAWLLSGDVPDELPTFKRKPSVDFPDEMRKADQPGYALALSFVGADGKSRSSPRIGTHKPFERAIDDGFRDWKFNPAKRAGQPVDGWIWVSVIFNPKSASAKEANASPRLLAVTPVITSVKPTSREAAPVIYVKLKLDATGAITESTLEEKQPAKLQRAVEDALKQWRFAPARVNGQPVAAEITIPVICQPPPEKAVPKGTPPSPLKQAKPEYPEAMSRSGLRGEVVVMMVIDAAGDVKNPVVVRSSNPGFDEAALKTVLKWKFKPAMSDGKPVSVEVGQTLVFELANYPDRGREAMEVELTGRKARERLPEELRFDVAPKPRGVVNPVYPYELLRQKVDGKVVLTFLVDPNGRISFTKIIEASKPEFGLAMVAAVEAYQFEPALKAGRPTQAMLKTEQEFKSFNEPDATTLQRLLRWESKDPEKIISAQLLDKPLKPVSQKRPVFPRSVESPPVGRAVIEFLIDEDGEVRLPRVIEATTPAFGFAAVQAVSFWRFEPPVKNGKAVVTRARVPFEFAIEKEKPTQP